MELTSLGQLSWPTSYLNFIEFSIGECLTVRVSRWRVREGMGQEVGMMGGWEREREEVCIVGFSANIMVLI